MANAYVGVAPDGSGKKIQTFENSIGGTTVEAQAVGLVDSTGTPIGVPTNPIQTQDPDFSITGSITAADTASTTTQTTPATNINHNIITGTPTAASFVTLTTSGESAFSGQITGTWSGTLQVERTVDGGVTWTDIAVFVAGQPGTTKTFIANSAFHGNASAAAMIRIRATAFSSGTANIVLRTGSGTGTITLGTPVGVKDFANPSVQLAIKAASTAAAATDTSAVVALSPNSPVPAGTNTIGLVNQGTAAAIGNAWFVRITDGTNTAAVKAASTAAAATDPAAVVSLSPNSPVPAGTNKIGTVDIATAAAVAKGTQGNNGVPTQDLKDSGRTSVVLNASGIATVATIALVTMQSYKSGTVATGITNYTVTTGKTLRVQKILITMRPTTPSTTVTFASCTFALRQNSVGSVATSSSIVLTGTALVTTSSPSVEIEVDVPDGLEFGSTNSIGFTQVGTTGGTFDLSLIGFEY